MKIMFRICALLALGAAASLQTLHAQQRTLEGVWNVSVTVTNCSTGAIIRTVQSVQAFHHDGSMTETANTGRRGMSEGVWAPLGAQMYSDTFWFYRYNADGTFASLAKGTDTITLGSDGTFTSTGSVHDYDANGNLISTGCVLHTAFQLINSEQ